MSRETERLESQIQQDRQEVKHTLDALQDKFSVDSIIQDLFGASNGGAKNTAEQIWSQLRKSSGACAYDRCWTDLAQCINSEERWRPQLVGRGPHNAAAI
jgi:hypothetical protein